MEKANFNKFLAMFLLFAVALSACIISTQPISQEQQLQSTIVSLQTEVARGSTSAPATPTSIPSLTPLSDTQPGTILEVGQAWRQGGVEIQLMETALYTNGLGVRFVMRNLEHYDKSVRYSLENFTANDNHGNRILVAGLTCQGCFDQDCSPTTQVLSGQGDINLWLDCYYGQARFIGFVFDTSDPSINELVVTVSRISTVNQARWRVPIYH